jgi:hypothetical protein
VAAALAFWTVRQDDRHEVERAAFLATVQRLADVTHETAAKCGAMAAR